MNWKGLLMPRILVALDDSLISLHAAHEAARLFPNGEFLAITVTRRSVPWIASGWDYGTVYPVVPFDLPEVGPYANEIAARAGEAGLPDAEILVSEGDPARAICAAAESHAVDVIVVGSHAKSALRRIVDPSVSLAVLHSATRPVLVVNAPASD
jgi:nucleotide-binding universal stress UspA family protein